MNHLLQLAKDETGQDLIEYSLIITFIAIACLALIGAGHPATVGLWQTANSDMTAANTFAFGH